MNFFNTSGVGRRYSDYYHGCNHGYWTWMPLASFYFIPSSEFLINHLSLKRSLVYSESIFQNIIINNCLKSGEFNNYREMCIKGKHRKEGDRGEFIFSPYPAVIPSGSQQPSCSESFQATCHDRCIHCKSTDLR